MNKLLTLLSPLILLFLFLNASAQAPQQFNYQGALRNADGSPVANKSIRLRLSVLDGSATGMVQYAETRQVTTSALGLYNVAIGSAGTLTSTNNFPSINWASGLKYLAVEVDLNGGSAFVTAGASQLLSVPYALYAANSGQNGKSAYEIWQAAGNTGTVADFLNSLKGAAGSPTGAATGDLLGTYPAPTVVKIQGVNVSSVAPAVNEYLKFDGVSWKAAPIDVTNLVGRNVTTANSDIIALTNNTGAALKDMSINIKAGAANSVLVTAADNTVKWQNATDAKLVTGTLFNFVLDKLIDNTSQLQANTSAIVKANVAGAVPGNAVFVTALGDVMDFSIVTSWVSAVNEISIRLANYQPDPVSISGKQYRIFLVQ